MPLLHVQLIHCSQITSSHILSHPVCCSLPSSAATLSQRKMISQAKDEGHAFYISHCFCICEVNMCLCFRRTSRPATHLLKSVCRLQAGCRTMQASEEDVDWFSWLLLVFVCICVYLCVFYQLFQNEFFFVSFVIWMV